MPSNQSNPKNKSQENEFSIVEILLARSCLYSGVSSATATLGYGIRFSLGQTDTGLINAAFKAGVGGFAVAVPLMTSLYFLSNGREFSLSTALAIFATAGAAGAALLGGDASDGLDNGVYGVCAATSGMILGFDLVG